MESRIMLEEVLQVLADYQPTGIVERRFTPVNAPSSAFP
jgi:hypothetical protein